MSYLNDLRPGFSSEWNSFAKNIFADEVTAEKVRRHLSDEHDMITDEDMENIKTEINPAVKDRLAGSVNV